MKWVKWTHWTKEGCVEFGQMPMENVQKNLQTFETEARKILKETGADHVLYGVKLLGDDYEVEEVKFYLEPMTDEEFEKKVASIPGVQVYAVHAMR